MSDDTLASNLHRHVERLSQYIRTPQSEGYRSSQDYLREQISLRGQKVLEHRFEPWGYGVCTNLYCEIGEPTLPRILIGAHYESREESGFAADDNASACAVLLELIPSLERLKGFSFTVIFFDMEEIHGWSALRGSRAFARWYNRPIAKAIILDTVGGTLVPGFENTFLQFGPGFRKFKTPGAEFLHVPVKVVEPFGPMFARSDYDEFRNNGVPYVFISAGTPWYYHTPYDTIDKVSFSKLAMLTRAIVDLLEDDPHLKHGVDGVVEDLVTFVTKLAAVPELQTPRIVRYAALRRDLSRLQIILLYKDALKIIRKLGPKLFERSSKPSQVA